MSEFILKCLNNGEEISLGDMTEGPQRQTLRMVYDAITESSSSERCPVHGAAAVVICDGVRTENLHFTVQGCCQDFVKSVEAQLEELLKPPPAAPKPAVPKKPVGPRLFEIYQACGDDKPS